MRDHLIEAHMANVRKAGEALAEETRAATHAYNEAIAAAEVKYVGTVSDSEVVLETLTDHRNRKLSDLASEGLALFSGEKTEPEEPTQEPPSEEQKTEADPAMTTVRATMVFDGETRTSEFSMPTSEFEAAKLPPSLPRVPVQVFGDDGAPIPQFLRRDGSVG